MSEATRLPPIPAWPLPPRRRHSLRILPSAAQQARSNGQEPPAPGPPNGGAPLLRTYHAVIHGQLVEVKRYGLPPNAPTPLPKRLQRFSCMSEYGIDPDTI